MNRIENTGSGSSQRTGNKEKSENVKICDYSHTRIFQRQEPKMLFVLIVCETSAEQTSKRNIVHGLKTELLPNENCAAKLLGSF